MKKLIIAIIVVGAVGALLWFAFRPVPVVVDIGHVARGSLEVTLDHEGRTRVRDRYVIRAPIAGTLRRILLDPGDEVRAGESELAIIDPLEPALLDERAVASAEARVRTARAGLERAGRMRDKAREQVRLARTQFAREQTLQAKQSSSLEALDRAERDLRLWEGELRSAEAGVKVAAFELAVNSAALLRTRPDDENYPAEANRRILLTAPIDGHVFRTHRKSSGPVAPGDALLDLGDISSLEIVADYLSTDAVQMRPGMRARIWGWGGRALSARLRLIEPSGFTKISALGVEEQRVNVILDLTDPSPSSALGDGFRVEVSVIVFKKNDLLKIPEAALFRHEAGWAVFLITQQHTHLMPVEIGRRNGLFAQVLTGLSEGDAVVLHPSDAVMSGIEIRPR